MWRGEQRGKNQRVSWRCVREVEMETVMVQRDALYSERSSRKGVRKYSCSDAVATGRADGGCMSDSTGAEMQDAKMQCSAVHVTA